MLENQSIKTKTFFLVTAVAILSFLAVVLVVTTRSMTLAKNDAFNLAEEMADKYKNEIMAELQGARVTSETLATVFETLKEHDVTSREMMNDILQNALARKEYITAFCIAYDPDALDGKDSEYAGQAPEYDETGRFAPYWNKLGGNIEVEPLYDIDIADWYIVPKETKKEYITDPYPYMVQGHEVMLASFIFPVIYQDNFIGIISSDIVLDKLQEMASHVNTRGSGEFTTIFSNTGVVVAHPDNDYFGKEITDIPVSDAREAKEAIKDGNLFISSGRDFYTVYMPIQFSAATNPWSVAVSFPMAEVLKTAGDLRNFVIIISVISICAIAIILYLIALSITRPVLVLANTAKIIGEGNFDTEIPVSPGSDEIGVLSKAFKVMTENLIAAKKQAEESSRAKSDFLSNMSHEMRTPLNAVIGMTNIGKVALDTEKKDYAFGKIEDASTHLLGVINDVLDMSKIEANKMELSLTDFVFEKMVRKVVNVINFRVDEKNQNFYVSIDKNIPKRLVGDSQRLSQVITNLLSNAVKFTPESGSIRMDASLIEEKGGICTIKFEVSDTGIGISQEQQARLFTSFQQADSSTSRKFGGTGLGLVISKRIVELMGGQIYIESALGKGAAFIFTVKLESGKEERRSLLNPDVSWENLRVLAVDDDPEILEYFQKIAGGLGISCDTASSGEEAAVLLEKNIWHDIYFIDWKMPGMNGIDLTRKIKTMYPVNSVVTMISSTEWSIIADEARAAGVDHFLSKPLFPSDITDCINECLGIGSSRNPADETMPAAMDTFSDRCLLLAEDVEINREIVIAMLEPMELKIKCAENGAETLRLFSEDPDHYDMIFMDVQMPEMDGLEATRRIRAFERENARREVPIIAMTANVFKEDVDRCRAAGMDDHIGKPLDMDTIVEKLRKYL